MTVKDKSHERLADLARTEFTQEDRDRDVRVMLRAHASQVSWFDKEKDRAKPFGLWLREVLDNAGYSAEEFARFCGVEQTPLEQLLTGKINLVTSTTPLEVVILLTAIQYAHRVHFRAMLMAQAYRARDSGSSRAVSHGAHHLVEEGYGTHDVVVQGTQDAGLGDVGGYLAKVAELLDARGLPDTSEDSLGGLGSADRGSSDAEL